MIFVSHALPVNVPDEPRLTPANVWDGLVLKANNALPFVPAMTYCEVTRRHSDTVFDRRLPPGRRGHPENLFRMNYNIPPAPGD